MITHYPAGMYNSYDEVKILCDVDGCEEETTHEFNNISREQPTDILLQIVRKFGSEGWRITEEGDCCPTCAEDKYARYEGYVITP